MTGPDLNAEAVLDSTICPEEALEQREAGQGDKETSRQGDKETVDRNKERIDGDSPSLLSCLTEPKRIF